MDKIAFMNGYMEKTAGMARSFRRTPAGQAYFARSGLTDGQFGDMLDSKLVTSPSTIMTPEEKAVLDKIVSVRDQDFTYFQGNRPDTFAEGRKAPSIPNTNIEDPRLRIRRTPTDVANRVFQREDSWWRQDQLRRQLASLHGTKAAPGTLQIPSLLTDAKASQSALYGFAPTKYGWRLQNPVSTSRGFSGVDTKFLLENKFPKGNLRWAGVDPGSVISQYGNRSPGATLSRIDVGPSYGSYGNPQSHGTGQMLLNAPPSPEYAVSSRTLGVDPQVIKDTWASKSPTEIVRNMAHDAAGSPNAAINRKGVSTGLHEFIVPQESMSTSREVWKVGPDGKTMFPTRMQTPPALTRQHGFFKTPPIQQGGITAQQLATAGSRTLPPPATTPPLQQYLSQNVTPALQSVGKGVGQFASGVMTKGAPWMIGADVARGALDPEGTTVSYNQNLREMKSRPIMPGSTGYQTPTANRGVFGANEEANTASWEAYNRTKGEMSLPRLAVNPLVENWKKFHLGKGGAIANTILQTPARIGAAIAKPLWDKATQEATAKPTSFEVDYFRKGVLQNPNYRKTAPIRAAAVAPPVIKPPAVAPPVIKPPVVAPPVRK